MRATASASNAQLEEARFTLQQIEAVNPEGGEYEETRDWLARAEHAEVLARNSHGAAEALSGDGGALDALNTAISLIEEASRADESLAPFATTLRETCFVVEDVARDMAGYCDSIDFDGESLAAAQERMGQLMGLMRSFGPTMEAVFERWDAAAALVGLIDDADENLARAEAALEAAEAALAQAAAAYDAARAEAAPQFAAAVNEVLGRLEMGTAALVCTVEPLPRENWSAAGSASVVFEFKPGASMQPRPLARIASGGEISRVMLAIKVALGAKDGTETLVFDEVDAGVGGSTANALATVLAERRGQPPGHRHHASGSSGRARRRPLHGDEDRRRCARDHPRPRHGRCARGRSGAPAIGHRHRDLPRPRPRTPQAITGRFRTDRPLPPATAMLAAIRPP